jgi:hypothetical protein
MILTPKNTFKGRNSDGSTFRIQEWDFATLSSLELGGFLVMFIFCMAFISIISPLVTILAILSFSGRFNFMYMVSILFGGYFIYDCLHGWMGVLCLSFFASEPTIGLLVKLNIASVVVSVVLMIFGGFIADMITSSRNTFLFYLFIVVLFVGSFTISGNVIPKDNGWVKRNIDYVSPKEKEEARQDSLKRALGDFKSQEERDAYFREMERKWGN